ncbi:hypothetical protein P8F81_10870 [Kosakonia cowanii]|uniref:hypothetical protein n=1 Tax=Kosakonia cowanii TaxID=208223 RepID=UPI002DDD4B62|nr:hypothetical protein [Kosakonia cowanii]WRY61453.1 hypothetical protein P8F81_10870 [Kosakonia cowanii]
MVKEKEKVLHLSQGEIVALKKAIMYLKFSCEETESLMYAGSPLINSAFSKIIEVDDLGWAAKEFYSKRHEINEEFIARKLTMMEKENGRPHDDAIMEQVFSECLYPFAKK